jgi:glycogen debranching enzyme
MANQTTIALKNSGTTGNTPTALGLAYGELAINYADGKIFYRTSSDTLGSYSIIVPGVNKDVVFNDNGVYGTNAGLTFDKATANLSVSNIVSTSSLNLNNISNRSTRTHTTSNTNTVVVDTFSTTSYRTAKYTMQLTSGVNHHSEEISIIHNGLTAKIVEYGVIYSDSVSLGSFDVNVNGTTLELTFTPLNNDTVLKFDRTLISV